jgi:hypothetical protein
MAIDRGNQHGPALDDDMAHEVEGYVRAGHDTRAEEWKSAEPPTDEASEVAPEGADPRRSTPPGMTVDDVENRSELASWLGPAVFPADIDRLADWLRDQHAPDHLLDEIRQAPADVEFASVGELWRALHGGTHVESTRY